MLRVDENSICTIKYTLSDAINDQAIIPMQFHLHDGPVAYKDRDQNLIELQHLSSADKKQKSPALQSALRTEMGRQIVESAWHDFNEHRQIFPTAKFLVLAANQTEAREVTETLRALGAQALLAISDDSRNAKENIRRYKSDDNCCALITVGMAYEGLDVPEISHIAVVTRIRSQWWIVQAVGRGVRINPREDYKGQINHLYCPNDPDMKEIINAIKAEQEGHARSDDGEPTGVPGGGGGGTSEVIPLWSQLEKITHEKFGELSVQVSDTSPIASPSVSIAPKYQEEILRKKVEKLSRRAAINAGLGFHQFNRQLKEKYGKSRSVMTLDELSKVFSDLQVMGSYL